MEWLSGKKEEMRKIYNFNLMKEGGHISGWLVSGKLAKDFGKKITFYENISAEMPYAVGDGNHSLATAKVCYENYKKTHSDTENAKKRTKKMLKKHPKINVIVTFNEWTTLGVGYAIQELGLKDNVRVVAFDSNVVSVGMLETGEVDTLIVQNSYAMGYLGVETAYKLINGYSIKDTIYTDTIAVDKENMYDEECQRRLFAFEKSNKN